MDDSVLLITRDGRIAEKAHHACLELKAEFSHVQSLDHAAELLDARLPDLILCDYATFEQLRQRWPGACVLIYTEPRDSEEAIKAIKHGAIDYLVRPISPEAMTRQIREALRVSHDINVPAVFDSPSESPDIDRIVGESAPMRELYKLIGLIAPRDVNVLITGESGTGKEMVARALYHHSPRKGKTFLAISCAAIPETLLESELFGHEKGAFTGADRQRMGKFEQCDGGTLFLDEIGDISLSTQIKLLRAIQDCSFQRLGGTEQINCDVRIVTATNQSLEQLIDERRFREDLYHRLKVASIHLPPLREREVDAVLLAHYFLERYNRRLGTSVQSVSPEVLPVFLKYAWPGNVRELENSIKSALVLARGSVLRLEHLPDEIKASADAASADPGRESSITPAAEEELRAGAERLVSDPSLAGALHRTGIGLIEREMILLCLQRNKGLLAPAARQLGISRTTLRKKMSEHGITVTAAIDRGE